MQSINADDFRQSIIYLFKETFEGSPKEGGMMFDTGVGVLNSISSINPKDASKSIAGATIAAHTEHIRYYLEVINNFLNGTVQVADWSRSWKIKVVADDEWESIRDSIYKEYKSVAKTFEKYENWTQDSVTQANAIIIHTAYHLGAIRQIIKSL